MVGAITFVHQNRRISDTAVYRLSSHSLLLLLHAACATRTLCESNTLNVPMSLCHSCEWLLLPSSGNEMRHRGAAFSTTFRSGSDLETRVNQWERFCSQAVGARVVCHSILASCCLFHRRINRPTDYSYFTLDLFAFLNLNLCLLVTGPHSAFLQFIINR